MIPLRDNIPHQRMPVVTVGLIIVNFLVFLYELFLGNNLDEFLYRFGVVPVKLGMDISFIDKIFPFLTSMFLHGGWIHLIGNSLFLWIFADNVEDQLGHIRFLFFYLTCGIVASFIHLLFNWNSSLPAIGASGAIAGVLGAYFIMFPRARVEVLVPFFFIWELIELPAFFFLGLWFIYQFVLGIFSVGYSGAGIAFWAHIGGFLAGVWLLKYFKKRREVLYYEF